MTANLVQAESNLEYMPNDDVMDLNPADVAKAVSAIDPYTTSYEEDSVQVILAIKDTDYLGKPLIVETEKMDKVPEERKTAITYTVQEGDTLSSIGWEYGLKIATIKATNSINSDVIKPGQKIKLPPQDLSPSYLATLQAKTRASAASGKSSGQVTAFKGTFARPTRGWNMSQGFGRTSFNHNHTGVDLTSRSGTAILASASGRVIAVKRGWGGGYGNHIIISHGNGFTTLYGHMSTFGVSVGQTVNQGQQIGVMGNTGWSTGVHLHFEIRKNGVILNPLKYL